MTVGFFGAMTFSIDFCINTILDVCGDITPADLGAMVFSVGF